MSVLDIQEAGPLKLPLAEIRIDSDLQCRANGVSRSVVREYLEVMRDKGPDVFVAVTVFRDSKNVHWLADGFTRCAALALLDETASIKVEIHEGSRKDALLYAAGANASHGQKRSQADRRSSVAKILSEPAWAKRADNWIAGKASVSPHLVAKVRSTLQIQSDGPRETSDGRLMDTSAIGKAAASDDTVVSLLTKRIESAIGHWPDSRHADLLALLTRWSAALTPATEAAE